MELFFYGTLLDADVRRAILGADAAGVVLHPAVLPGFHRYRSSHGDYPVLLRRSGGRVRGLLAQGLGRPGLLRIGNFEGEDYAPARALVIGADGGRRRAWIYLASVPGPLERGSWSLRAWQLRSKPRLIRQLHGWMGEFGADSLEAGDLRWHVRRRLWAHSEIADS